MKNLIDFAMDMANNTVLGNECVMKLHEGDCNGFFAWLKGKGYDVDENECKKLFNNKDNIKDPTTVGLFY